MSNAASGLAHLKPFLPGLEPLLEDAEVSEIMINGPGNVWIEAGGRLTAHAAPGLDESALLRAAIHIARPLGLDPATTPIIDARLDDGSRVAICVPPTSPHVAITIRRFGKRTFSPADLVEQKALPENVLKAAERMLMTRRNILVSGGTGSGKTTLLNALIELLPVDERIVAIEDTLELRIDHSNCVRFEARGLQEGAVTIRDLVRHALRHRPDHIVVGEVRGGEAADLLQALNTGHGGSLTTVHANNAESALSRIASCAMQGGGELPWEVTCRGVVDGIAMVIHMTRREGRRFVEEAAFVKGYEAAENRWVIQPVWPPPEGYEERGEPSRAGGELVKALCESSPQARHHFTRFDQVEQLVRASEATADTGFMARLMMLCSLPRTNPGRQLQHKRVNGPYTLIMTAVGQTGLPFGNLSRLLLAWVCTEAVRTQSRELFLGASLSGFMRRLGLAPIGGGSRGDRTRLRDQMRRLFNAHIQLAYEDKQVSASVNSPVASRTGFWWNERKTSERLGWESKVELGEKFFHEIIRHPVPMDLNILKALKRSSLGIDLYLWLTYRTFTLKRPLRLSWASLYRQFGADPVKAGERVTVDNFRKDCLRELKKIKVAWMDLNYVAAPGALVLRSSKPAVPRAASSRRVALRSPSLAQNHLLKARETIGRGRTAGRLKIVFGAPEDEFHPQIPVIQRSFSG